MIVVRNALAAEARIGQMALVIIITQLLMGGNGWGTSCATSGSPQPDNILSMV
jgi:hypothetical protein